MSLSNHLRLSVCLMAYLAGGLWLTNASASPLDYAPQIEADNQVMPRRLAQPSRSVPLVAANGSKVESNPPAVKGSGLELGELMRLRDQREMLEERVKVAKAAKELADLGGDACGSGFCNKPNKSNLGNGVTEVYPRILSVRSGGRIGSEATIVYADGTRVKVHKGSNLPGFGTVTDITTQEGVRLASGDYLFYQINSPSTSGATTTATNTVISSVPSGFLGAPR